MTGSSSRMLALLSLLQTQRDWPGQVLADRLDVTPRTVRRDVDRLRELGYRISAIKGPDGGYRLAAGSELPPLLFDDEQAVAIAVALQSVPATGIDIDEGAARALATVRQVMPSRLRHRVDGIRFTGVENETRVDPAVLEAVSAAVRDRRVLRFDYGDHDRPPRRTEPHAVVAREGRWYLLAWDLEADDWRTFRLDRMTPRIPTGPAFTPRELPAADAQTYLAARAKGSDAGDRWPCIGELVLEVPAREVAHWIGRDGSVELIDDTSCRVTVGSWSWTGILASVARFDAPFRVEGPPALADAARALAARLGAAS
ncbi:putative DNA-binding transcriptional regulator YafY [Microbacterium phyllosphaerae]|uniref:DNA-binding transcriptional regulator YafY n=1 Tax=Microbacterium phyllosphaerae TaxID=124798 RepID=A0ABS4WM13_9MICO|nr:WYL domain-containing protein [Microbacterium phyllosphaerae]MBP2377248.1 putative DNA-binding transcriptional regulator YafY [Microbacterium phyllosphaerae]